MFSVALHMRQGDIASIRDGARQLDIVLGVTAASMAEEELRQMALELEKDSAGLAVLQERLRTVGKELSGVAAELATLADSDAELEEKLKLWNRIDPTGEVPVLTLQPSIER